MKNVTITLPEDVIDRVRSRAAESRVSMNRFLRDLISRATATADEDWPAKHRKLLDEMPPHKREGTWNREEIYAERLDRVR